MDHALGVFIKFMMLPGQALIPASFAGRLSVVEGDSLHLLISGEWKRVVIVPLYNFIQRDASGDRLSDENLLVCDIASAILSLLIERMREFGILRAIGMRWAQLRRMIFLESGLMGALASLLAMPTGFALALVLVHVINVRSFGWSIGLRSHPLEYAQIAVIALTAALLAASYPMWQVKKIFVAAALREK